MFSYLTSLFTNPVDTLIFFLLAFPGRILAISAHEFAHAWVADKCGDPTARNLGRLTLNPLKHLDVLGTIMMLLLGFGWAKPVPVNPRNYRNYRKDDLKVSLAGITMNLIMFLLGYLGLALFLAFTVRGMTHVANFMTATGSTFVGTYAGETCVVVDNSYMTLSSLFHYAPYAGDFLITPVLGRLAGYIYQMLSYFVQVNVVLAVFNLLPVPPLDGYHVVNDLLIKRSLFADARTARIAMGIMMVLMFSGILGQGLGYVEDAVMGGVGSGFFGLFHLIGLA